MATVRGLFTPERVAVVGATDRPGSVGRALLTNLRQFDGEVFPVNPGRETVLGATCYPSLSAVPAVVDLVVVAVPPGAAVDVVREAGECGIRNAVVVTAGFAEAGSDGAARERDLRAVAEEYGIALVGPNSLGVMSTPVGLNATFAPEAPLPGSVSFLSQSGALVTAVLDWARAEGIGFRHVVSLGNEAVVDETDVVEAWGDDPGTSVVVGYLEGIEDGRAFVEAVREVTRHTPVVLVKSGRTEAGAGAAASHTGAMAGSDRAAATGLERAGALRAHSVGELFDVSEALAGQPAPDGSAVAVVTNAGGPGVMATDAAGDADLSLASFDDATVAALRTALPGNANVYNPVDVIGDADDARFGDALDAVLADPGVDAAVAIAAPTAVLDYEALAAAIGECHETHGKPVVASLMGGDSVRDAERVLRAAGVPNYFDPARAVASLDALARYREIADRPPDPPRSFDVDRERARAVLETAARRGDVRVGVEALDLLSAYGIPTAEGEVAETPEAAVEVARSLPGDDVAMKIVSPDILHKTDIGGVKVGVAPGDVPDAFEDLVSRAHAYQPDAAVRGVLVQELIDMDGGVETIVGASRDPQFGPLALVGLGGVFVEVLSDTAVGLAPVGEREARAMVSRLRGSALLGGVRGRTPVDRAALVECVERVSRLAADFPAILELDVNPLVAAPGGVCAVDVRLSIDPEEL